MLSERQRFAWSLDRYKLRSIQCVFKIKDMVTYENIEVMYSSQVDKIYNSGHYD
jgi:hypothetical protein